MHHVPCPFGFNRDNPCTLRNKSLLIMPLLSDRAEQNASKRTFTFASLDRGVNIESELSSKPRKQSPHCFRSGKKALARKEANSGDTRANKRRLFGWQRPLLAVFLLCLSFLAEIGADCRNQFTYGNHACVLFTDGSLKCWGKFFLSFPSLFIFAFFQGMEMEELSGTELRARSA